MNIKWVLALTLNLAFVSANVIAEDCTIRIKSISVTPVGKLVQDVESRLIETDSSQECEVEIKQILKAEYPFGESVDGMIGELTSWFYSGTYKIYYFAEYSFSNYDYDLGLLNTRGRLQVNSKKSGKNRIYDEHKTVLLK